MTKEIENIRNEEWYEALIEECKAILTEAIFTSRWALVEGYWHLGERIESDTNFKKFAKGNHSSLQDLANNLNISERTLYYARKAYNKFPELGQIPDGKNITWNKLITLYLPEPKEEKEIIELPKGKFNVIYADPPWRYEFSSDPKDDIENKYPTMELEDIKNLQVPSAENSVLLLWATAPKLEEALQVLNNWGFRYRTCAVWDKEWIGMGYWFRGEHELLLVGVKGNFETPEPTKRFSSMIRERRTEHSRKPKQVYEMIETMFPKGKGLELFNRGGAYSKYWTVWGNESNE